MEIDKFKSVFNVLVSEINTLSPGIRLKIIPELNIRVKHYLDHLMVKGDVYEYSCRLERRGQTKIWCCLNYMDKSDFIMKEFITEATLRTPVEVRGILFDMFIESLVVRNKN